MAIAKKAAAQKAVVTKGAKEQLVKQLAEALGVPAAEVELRALRELAEKLAPKNLAKGKPAERPRGKGVNRGLPQRLYLLMAGRGLDGGGMPVEVIDVPCIVGSSKRSTVWVNQPQIETKHLQIYETDEGWTLEDLGSEHGTFLGDERVTRRAIEHGDEYLLAGYLRMRTELR